MNHNIFFFDFETTGLNPFHNYIIEVAIKKDGVNEFYEKLSNTLKHKYEGCDVWIISSDLENIKMIGLKPSQKIKLQNGNLDSSFRKFEIYKGSKKGNRI